MPEEKAEPCPPVVGTEPPSQNIVPPPAAPPTGGTSKPNTNVDDALPKAEDQPAFMQLGDLDEATRKRLMDLLLGGGGGASNSGPIIQAKIARDNNYEPLISEPTGPFEQKKAVLVNKDGKNAHRMYCKRCGSTIALENVATYVEKGIPLHKWGSKELEEETPKHYFKFTKQFDFENVGVSKPLATNKTKCRYLTCADCDMGPLGIILLGGEFYVNAENVAYLKPDKKK